jgi:alpha-galactosidase
MPINFNSQNNVIFIETKNTVYAMKLLHDKFLVHLYYGEKGNFDINLHNSWMDFSPDYNTWRNLVPENLMTEYVGFDSGDWRASSLRVKNKYGQSNVFLDYVGYRIFDGRLPLGDLPSADADENTQTLEISLIDNLTNLSVKL